MLDFATCNAARLRRDPGHDRMFFVAVRTTLIRRRPVGRVRQPRTKNVTFWPGAAACEHAGYRPCRRCRPQAAPFSPAWQGTRTTADCAPPLIDGGAGFRERGCLADRLGIGARHSARLFNMHLGGSGAREMAG